MCVFIPVVVVWYSLFQRYLHCSQQFLVSETISANQNSNWDTAVWLTEVIKSDAKSILISKVI